MCPPSLSMNRLRPSGGGASNGSCALARSTVVIFAVAALPLRTPPIGSEKPGSHNQDTSADEA
jgi:hypothetical protein